MLNLGSGGHAGLTKQCDGDWVNVDKHDLDAGRDGPWTGSPDVQCDATDMPFDDATFDGAYLGHVLEHLTYDDVLPRALAEMCRVLKPGAVVAVVGPCIRKAVQTDQPDWLLAQIVPGEPGPPGIAHAWMPTTGATLAALVACPGLTNVREVSVTELRCPRWPNAEPDALWQCAFLAERR